MNMNNPEKPNKNHSVKRNLRLEDIQNVMTKDEMAAFLSACRIRYGTAGPEDFAAVARFERRLADKKM